MHESIKLSRYLHASTENSRGVQKPSINVTKYSRPHNFWLFSVFPSRQHFNENFERLYNLLFQMRNLFPS